MHPVLSLTSTEPCEGYNATKHILSLGQATSCLPRLSDPEHVSDYDVCKTRLCFLFIRSSPVISFDTGAFNSTAVHLQRTFPCNDPRSLHASLRGVAFEILRRVAQIDSLCIWAGPANSCTFNTLVDYTAVMAERGYNFAITGLLLDLPRRRCNHVPSAPILDNRIVIIGKREVSSNGPLQQLAQPFRLGSWLIIVALLFMFLTVAFVTVLKMKSITKENGFLTALQMFTGDKGLPFYDDAATYGNRRLYWHRKVRRPNNVGAALRIRTTTPLRYRARRLDAASQSALLKERDQEDNLSTRIARYNLSMALFRIALATFFAVFALFYEVAVVNFLFQQGSVQLSKSLQLLSKEELKKYAVLKNSALEVVWNGTVNKNRLKYDGTQETDIPWKRCNTGQECIQWVADDFNDVEYAVTYETKGKYLIQQVSTCEKLAIIKTKDDLYHFSSGWLYTRAVERNVIERIDREIVSLRMRGEISRIFEYETGDNSCDPVSKPDIGPSIILVPCGFLVLPLLCGSLFVLIFWGRNKGKDLDENGEGDLKKRTSSGKFESDIQTSCGNL